MFKNQSKKRVLTFSHFSRKSWALFGCLHREVRIGVLSAATLACAAPCLQAANALPCGSVPEEAEPAAASDTLDLGEAQVAVSV